MFKKQPVTEPFQVLLIDSIVVKDGRFYRVHDYGLVEIAPPVELVKPEQTDENSQEA